ncbi:MAG: Cyanovirin-N [Benniella sp.]|nr:MAG: Cyanovirin-N [Benniella sp.]
MRLSTLALLCFGAVVFAAPTSKISIDVNGDGDDDGSDSILECKNLQLINGHILSAQCQACFCDEYQETTLDLNQILGNNNAHFEWGSAGFLLTAYNVRLEGTTLKADLEDVFGDPKPDEIDLTERIKNVDGKLTYVVPAP